MPVLWYAAKTSYDGLMFLGASERRDFCIDLCEHHAGEKLAFTRVDCEHRFFEQRVADVHSSSDDTQYFVGIIELDKKFPYDCGD